MTRTIADEHWPVAREFCRPPVLDERGVRYIGVTTPHGIAVMDIDHGGVTIDFVHGGQMHRRRIEPALRQADAEGRAYAFVREVVAAGKGATL
jgi:hypothetical protein